MEFRRQLLQHMLYLPILFATLLACAKEGSEPGKGQPEQPQEWSGPELKVMAYNIHHCNPPSEPELIDVEAIAKVIRSESPDLVALQEVDVHTFRSGKDVHQAKVLAELTGMHYYFKKAIDYEGGAYGVAVLSRFPIDDTLGFALPMAAGLKGEPRAVAAVKVQLPDGQQLIFASTHLDLHTQHRTVQAQKLVEAFTEDNSPVIIGGDFNDVAGSGPIDRLDESFRRTCIGANCPGTIPVVTPTRTIDYVFYRPLSAMRVKEHRVVPETYASDHCPVVAVLQMND